MVRASIISPAIVYWPIRVIHRLLDHGQHLGEKMHWRKQALWEESTQVPLFVKIPGRAPVGSKTDKAVSLLDIYPTLVELCDLPAAPKLEGNSLVSLIERPDSVWNKPVLSTWYYKNHSVRSNDWRYIRYRDGGEELYDHRTDPGEHINLAGNPYYADVIARLKKTLPDNDTLTAGTTEWEPDKLDRLVMSWMKNDSIQD